MPDWHDHADDLAAAVADAFGLPAVYRRTTDTAFNAATGARDPTVSETTVRAVRQRSTVSPTDAGRRVEVTRWTIPAADLAFVPRVDDRLAVSGDEHAITLVERSVDGRLWELTTRRSVS